MPRDDLSMRARIRQLIASIGANGATCDEVEKILRMKHQTASARINELCAEGHIVRSGDVRKTRGGVDADVWIVPKFAPDPRQQILPFLPGR